MKKLYTSFCILFFIQSNIVTAQHIDLEENLNPPVETCGFDAIHRKMMNEDVQYRQLTNDFNEMLRNGSFVPEKAGIGYQVPVVVHILHIGEPIGTGYNLTDDVVRKAIENLNNYWRKITGSYGDGGGVDMEIEFALAVRDPSGNCTNGIVRRDMSSYQNYIDCGVVYPSTFPACEGVTDLFAKDGYWPTNQYYNIYLVNYINGANCQTGGGDYAGYAYYASAHGSQADGTIIWSCYFTDEKSSILTHELGHAFNEMHTFEGDGDGSTCPTVMDGCGTDQGDCCTDTPPHRRTSAITNLYWDCGNTDVNDCDASTNRQDHMKNYMDYSGCRNEFTNDQKNRANAALAVQRASFLEANGNNKLVPPSPPVVNFSGTSRVVCKNTPVKFTDLSTCIPNTYATNPGWTGHTFSWSFTGPATLSSSDQNPEIIFTVPGKYDVSLIITNTQGTFSEAKTGYITVVDSPATSFCTPASDYMNAYGYTVYHVMFGDIDNTTSNRWNFPYTDFSCTHGTELELGEVYPISVSVSSGASYVHFFQVWIDWNDNGVWDAGEMVFDGNSGATATMLTLTGNVSIPVDAVQSKFLRMRVMGEAYSAPSENKRNCVSNFFIGDVEDYAVYISPPCETTITSFTSSPTSICSGDETTLTVDGNLGNADQWYLFSGNCGGTLITSGLGPTFTVSPILTTTYFVRGEGDCIFSECEQVNVVPTVLNLSTSFSGGTIMANTTGATYQWIDCNEGNSLITGATNQSFSPLQDGSFAVVITQNGCSDTSECVLVSNLSINKNEPRLFAAYPNPVTNELTMVITPGHAESYTLVDNTGHIIFSGEIKSEETVVDMEHLPSGVYFIHLSESDNVMKVVRK